MVTISAAPAPPALGPPVLRAAPAAAGEWRQQQQEPQTEPSRSGRGAASSAEPQRTQTEQQQQEDEERVLLIGKLACLGVAFLWGSYAPALRLVYSTDGPPGPIAVMLFRGVLQAAVLVCADALASTRQRQQQHGELGKPAATAAPVPTAGAGVGAAVGSSGDATGAASWWGQLQADNLVLLGGLELGLWNFLATMVQSFGLQLTSATKAGFLIASTSLFTPLLSAALGEQPRAATWAGSVIALAGTMLIAADKAAADAGAAGGAAAWISGGDAAILCAALFYSLATVRLSSYARLVTPVKLAAAKSLVLGSAAVLTAGATVWSMQGDVEQLWPGWNSPGAGVPWAVLAWSAVGPGALAAFLHARGQAIVPAAEAQVIFSSTPLWSAAAAWVMLGGEPVSEKTWVGGLAIVVAGLVASRNWRGG